MKKNSFFCKEKVILYISCLALIILLAPTKSKRILDDFLPLYGILFFISAISDRPQRKLTIALKSRKILFCALVLSAISVGVFCTRWVNVKWLNSFAVRIGIPNVIIVGMLGILGGVVSVIYLAYILLILYEFFEYLFVKRTAASQNVVCEETVALKMVVASIIVISFLASLPLLQRDIVSGHDIAFHLMRIEGMAEALKSGQLPVRLASSWLEGAGYAVDIFYGNLLLYIPACLRILGMNLVSTYKILLALLNVGTTVIAYVCFTKMLNGDKKLGLLISGIYVLESYRLVNMYVRAAVGESSAMMFFPIIALAIYRIYEECSNRREYWKNSIILAIGMTGVIESHILGTEMVVVILALICVLLFKKTFRKRTLLVYFSAVILTVLWNFSFLVPFLDYYLNMDVRIFSLRLNETMQAGCAYIAQYVLFFKNIFGNDDYYISDRMMITPGPILLIGLLICIAKYTKKMSKRMGFCIAMSIFLLWFSSDLFPWDYLIAHFKFFYFLAQVQFGWRYLGIASVFMCLVVGLFLQQIGRGTKKYFWWISGISILMVLLFTVNYTFENERVTSEKMSRLLLGHDVGGQEYVLSGCDVEDIPREIVEIGSASAQLVERNGCYISVYCKTGELGGSIEVPMYNYKGYQVWDEYGNDYGIYDGENRVIRFDLPADYEGKVYVDFVEPWYWRIAELISLISIIAGVLWWRKIANECRTTCVSDYVS